jgi:hypothetical protein
MQFFTLSSYNLPDKVGFMDVSSLINFRNKWPYLLKDVVLIFVIGILILGLSELIQNYSYISFISKSPEGIRILAFLILLVFLFISFKTIWQSIINLLKKNKIYKFRSQDWPNEWIFNGRIGLENSTDLHIQYSRAGCLLKNYLWKDFKMTFEMKFADYQLKHVGILFRAEDLDNYFMLEVTQDSPFRKDNSGKNTTGLVPHVRYQGGWEEMGLEMNSSFNFSEFVKVKLEVKNDTLSFYYKDKLVFNWILPTHVDVMYKESGIQQSNTTFSNVVNKETFIYVKEIPFRCNSGMVGFRAYPGQGAIIRGLKVQPI